MIWSDLQLTQRCSSDTTSHVWRVGPQSVARWLLQVQERLRWQMGKEGCHESMSFLILPGEGQIAWAIRLPVPPWPIGSMGNREVVPHSSSHDKPPWVFWTWGKDLTTIGCVLLLLLGPLLFWANSPSHTPAETEWARCVFHESQIRFWLYTWQKARKPGVLRKGVNVHETIIVLMWDH